MSQNKTIPTGQNVHFFLNGIEDNVKRSDALKLLELMYQIIGEKVKIWGKTIIGFGEYHYKYKSKREGEWFVVGFSPRKNYISIYLMCDLSNIDFQGLGKFKKGVGCIYFKKLSDINLKKLEEIILFSVQKIRLKHQ